MDLGNILQGLFGAGAGLYLSEMDTDRLENISDTLQTGFGDLATEARSAGTFSPFSITGTQGSGSAIGEGGTFGGLNVNLDSNTQAQVDAQRAAYMNYLNNYQSQSAPTEASGSFTQAAAAPFSAYSPAGSYMGMMPTAPSYTGNIAGTGMPSVGSGSYNPTGLQAPSAVQGQQAVNPFSGGLLAQQGLPALGSGGISSGVGGISLPGLGAGQLGGLPSNINIPGAGGGGIGNLPGLLGGATQGSIYNAQAQNPLYSQGAIASNLSPTTNAQSIMGAMGAGTNRSEADIFSMLEGMQEPGRERERLQLRDELAGQGRLGTQTAAYGGTPEELARAKAVEESRSGNAFRAFQLAGEEQARLAQQKLGAYGIGEQSAARRDQSLLQSFGLGTDSQRAATDLTNVLGSLGLQGRDISNRFLSEMRGQDITQRGQDIGAQVQGADIANRYDLGLLGQSLAQRGQDINALVAGQDMSNRFDLGLLEQQLGLRGQDIQQLLQGQDISNRFDLGVLGQGVTQRGQDLNALLSNSGQLNQYNLGMFGQDVTQRGQDINALLQSMGINADYSLGTRGQDVTQRGQDIDSLLQGSNIANQFNLGMFDAQSRNAIESAMMGYREDQLGLQASDSYTQALMDKYGIDAQQAMELGRQGISAAGINADVFNTQVQQQLGELDAQNAAYQSSFLPEQSLLDQLGLGADLFEIAQRGGIQGEQIAQNAVTNQLESAYNMETHLGALQQNQNQMLLQALMGEQQSGGDFTGGLLDSLFEGAGNWLSDLLS